MAAASSSIMPALIASPLDDVLVASLLNPRRKKRVDWAARYQEARPGHRIYYSPSFDEWIVQRFDEQGNTQLVARGFKRPAELEDWIQKELNGAGNPKRPSAAKRSLLLWSARNFGYEKASAEPTLADMQVIVEAEYVHRKVPATLLREMLRNAQAAYHHNGKELGEQNPVTTAYMAGRQLAEHVLRTNISANRDLYFRIWRGSTEHELGRKYRPKEVRPLWADYLRGYRERIAEEAARRPEAQNPDENPASTMGEAIALSSPSGRMSKRSLKAAQERLRVQLFGEQGLAHPGLPPQPDEKTNLLRRAQELRSLAERGMHPRKYAREAEKLERRAAAGLPPRENPLNKSSILAIFGRPVVQLIGVGEIEAIEAGQLRAGMKRLFNYGSVSEVVSVRDLGRVVEIETVAQDGKVYKQRLQKQVWVVAVPADESFREAQPRRSPNPCSYRVTRRFNIQ